MSYLDDSLVPGETVLYRTGLHWSVLLGALVAALIFELLAAAALVASFKLVAPVPALWALRIAGLGLAAAGLISIIAGVVRRSSVEMAVTNRRVLMKTGIVARRTVELLLTKVESIGVEQGVAGRLSGFGTVIVRGTGGTHEIFDRIARPLEFRRQVQQQIQQGPDAPPTPPGPPRAPAS